MGDFETLEELQLGSNEGSKVVFRTGFTWNQFLTWKLPKLTIMIDFKFKEQQWCLTDSQIFHLAQGCHNILNTPQSHRISVSVVCLLK